MATVAVVQDNVKMILDLIGDACNKSALSKKCRLVAVSKTKPIELIAGCYAVGQRHFGENYVQELEEKSHSLQHQCPEIKWHYIGKIQSNKIGKICSSPSLYCVETIESVKHCDLFNREMEKRQSMLDVLVQVNTSAEDQKGGLSIDDAPDLACYITDNCSSLRFSGFMTIGSFTNSHVVPNPDFDRLYKVRKAWATRVSRSPDEVELSMGMSDDFETAIAQGSTSSSSMGPLRSSVGRQGRWCLVRIRPSVCNLPRTRQTTPSKAQETGGSNFRPVCLKCCVFEGPPGSAYAEFGETKVLAKVYGPTDDPNGDSNAASLSLKMKGLTSSSPIASQVLSVIKTCVMVHKYSQCSFEVEVTVLNDDGGLLQCALMAATLALADAEVLVLDVVVAAHVARTPSGDWIVDPTSEQIVSGSSECTLALMPNQNQIVCCDIRGGHLTSPQIDEFITFATDKAMKLYPVLRKALLNTLSVEGSSNC
ncbi:Pyridoxal phosphate enzyme YggS family [Trichostrongylus colubriformis]|uniref:Pyridoxal phosphate homeostasis protein n=1 Tax=Trichostrongylus colubriformis TaxID=6319 RepID=A0AAN8J333_TRICO